MTHTLRPTSEFFRALSLKPHMRTLGSATLFILAALCLNGCGWQVRGSQQALSETPLSESGLSIQFLQRNPALTQVVHNTARSNHIEISSKAHTKLIIERERLEKQPLALTETGVAAQYQLILTLYFHVKNSETTLVPPTQISSWRSYDFDAKQIAAKSQEEQALLKEMRQELVNRMLLTIGSTD